MHLPFIALALVFSVSVTVVIVLLMERHVVRPAPPRDDPTAGDGPGEDSLA